MSIKEKGSNAERELLHMFWAKGWACLRSAGSGSMKYPGPDLLVGSREKNRRLAIECKTSKSEKVYLGEHDVLQLKDFCEIFDSRPWFAVKFSRRGWIFIAIEDIDKTPTGYAIDSKIANLRGLSFEELINY
jgi:Holliday junction resolvase